MIKIKEGLVKFTNPSTVAMLLTQSAKSLSRQNLMYTGVDLPDMMTCPLATAFKEFLKKSST